MVHSFVCSVSVDRSRRVIRTSGFFNRLVGSVSMSMEILTLEKPILTAEMKIEKAAVSVILFAFISAYVCKIELGMASENISAVFVKVNSIKGSRRTSISLSRCF